MKVSYISDLHLDFHVRFTKNQTKFEQRTRDFVRKLILTDVGKHEVLVIAGDLSHYNTQSLWALNEFSIAYEQVLFVPGNHDYYLVSKNQANNYKNNSQLRLIDLHSKGESHNVHIFDKSVGEYKGVRFYGSTMWYPLKTYEQQVFYSEVSNDSKLIKRINHYDEYEKHLEQYNKFVDDVDVVISHVPLIHMHSHIDNNNTHCYLNEVDKLAPYTICGHVHEQNEYTTVDGKKVYINAIGYDDEGNDLAIKNFKVGD